MGSCVLLMYCVLLPLQPGPAEAVPAAEPGGNCKPLLLSFYNLYMRETAIHKNHPRTSFGPQAGGYQGRADLRKRPLAPRLPCTVAVGELLFKFVRKSS